MNWLSNFVRPKIRSWRDGATRDIPDNLWHKCPSCQTMIFHSDLEDSLYVCPHCDFHMRIDPIRRLNMLFDHQLYHLVDLPPVALDPLKFRDQKRYIDRLKAAEDKTKRSEAIVVARGRINNIETLVVAFDFQFLGGSMGIAVGEGMLTAAKLAVLKDAPLIVVAASGGARMQEGVLSLMQMPRTIIAIEQVKEARLPYLVVLTDPTTGGVTASFAMLGDIQIAEKGALIGFAGARVIENTVRETLPEGFQRSESLLEYGMVDMVLHRRELRPMLMRILNLLVHLTLPAESSTLLLEGKVELTPLPYDAQPESSPPDGNSDP